MSSEDATPPPPPPPPMAPNFNINTPPPPKAPNFNITPAATLNDNCSRLLVDIRNGATLKKTSAAMLNGTGTSTNNISSVDTVRKQTQDALQAELSNTLRRRKPVVIDELPKYEYPIYDETPKMTKANETSSISNISDKGSIKKNTEIVESIVKPPNVNALLSVVTATKIPANIHFDTTAIAVNATVNKPPKISHGKPNFIINRIDSVAALNKRIEKDSIKSNDNKIVHVTKLDVSDKKDTQSMVPKPTPQTMNSIQKTVEKFEPVKSVKQSIPAANGNEFKSYGEVSSTLKRFNAMKSKPMDAPSNRISFVPDNNLVANKKALFEQQQQQQQPIDCKKSSPVQQTKKLPATKIYSHNDVKPSGGPSKVFAIHQSLNRTARAENNRRSVIDSIPVLMNKNAINKIEATTTAPMKIFEISKATTKDDTNQNGLIGYRKQRSTFHGTKSIDTKNFEQKTVVSFSKDLTNASNMYTTDQVCVMTETIITTQTHHFTENNGTESLDNFQNIRLSTGPNSQVVPKKK